MGKNSNIEWTHHTMNFWIGCAKVSAGCKNCYAETRSNRFGDAEWGINGTRKRTSPKNWAKPLAWDKQAVAAGIRQRVFASSLSDIFEDREDTNEMRQEVWAIIEATPNLDWLLLTKRPENIKKFMPERFQGEMPYNVWLGTSVENQEEAENRIDKLVKVPAPVHFLSCEPLLGHLNLQRWLRKRDIEWVIVGGESGPNARIMPPEAPDAIQKQCAAHGVPFHFKQWGKWLPFDGPTAPAGYNISYHERSWPRDKVAVVNSSGTKVTHSISPYGAYYMADVGKGKAGRKLNGQHWDQVPVVEPAGGITFGLLGD